MVEEESVRRFGRVLGVGKVYGPYGPYASSLGTRPIWVWVAQNRDEIDAAKKILGPHLSPRFAERLAAV